MRTKREWKRSRIRPLLTISVAGVPLAVGRGGFFPCFQIHCTCGLARLHAGFGFGSALRSHSQLLNPLQTTGQMIAFGDSESFISLLFLTYLESRNHTRKPIISKWVFWFFRVKRAQKEGKKMKKKKKKNLIAGVEFSLCVVIFSLLDQT